MSVGTGGRIVVAASVVAAVLVAPVTIAHADPRQPVPHFTDYDRAPWLVAPDIDVNPPGVVSGTVAAPPVERGYVITGDHLHEFEVTGTPEADAELRALVERVGTDAGEGDLDTTGYRVFVTPPILAVQRFSALTDGSLPIITTDDPESIVGDVTHVAPVGTDPADDALAESGLPELFVLPVGVGVGEIGAAWDEARLKVTTIAQETPVWEALTGVLQQEPKIDPQWDAQAPHCYARKSNDTAYYDPCYQYASLAKDGDANRVAWTHHQRGTGKSKGIWRLIELTVESNRKVGTPDQQWQDWSPDADVDRGNCDQTLIGISVKGIDWAKYFTHCDMWDMSKANPAVNFKVRWDGNAWRKDRNVAGMKTFSVPNGYAPTNAVRYDYVAR